MIRKDSLRLLMVVCVCSVFFCFGNGSAIAAEETEFTVGGLLSLTGNVQTLGKSSKAAMEIAISDANAAAAAGGLALRFKPMIYDTALEPAKAVEGFKMMAGKGIRFVIGPQSSAEVQAVKPLADSNGVIVVSQSSTAQNLAVAGDNVFRFCPSDELEGAAVATFLRRDKVKTVVPVWREDAGNESLRKAVTKAVTAVGGKVLDGVKYPSGQQDFAPVVKNLAAQVEAAVKQSGEGSVGVYITGFDEVASILALAAENPRLGTVKWYGSDGTALSKALAANVKAAAFAEKVSYLCPIFGVEENSRVKWSTIISRVEERAGAQSDGYALAAYDAVRVVAQTYIDAGGKVDDPEGLKRQFVKTANSYRGVTGRTVLNAAGDRKYGNYDFWTLRKTGSVYQWKLVGSYESE